MGVYIGNLEGNARKRREIVKRFKKLKGLTLKLFNFFNSYKSQSTTLLSILPSAISLFAYSRCEIIPSWREVSIIASICLQEFLRMSFLIAVLLSMNSYKPTLHLPSLVWRRYCDWTQRSDWAILSFTLSWMSGGNKEINLFTVLAAVLVWSVLNTRCPVSARFNAASAVAGSRISHTKMISGSSRIALLIAFA